MKLGELLEAKDSLEALIGRYDKSLKAMEERGVTASARGQWEVSFPLDSATGQAIYSAVAEARDDANTKLKRVSTRINTIEELISGDNLDD